jgi:hypothetical protein
VKDFDERSALLLSGWTHGYAVLLGFAASADVAIALVDTNGDGADVSLGRRTW